MIPHVWPMCLAIWSLLLIMTLTVVPSMGQSDCPQKYMRPPPFPDFDAIFAKTLRLQKYRETLDRFKSEEKRKAEESGKTYNCLCMWSYTFPVTGISGFNKQLMSPNCISLSRLNTICPTTTTSTTTTTITTTTTTPTPKTTTATTSSPITKSTTPSPWATPPTLPTKSTTKSSTAATKSTTINPSSTLSVSADNKTTTVILIPNSGGSGSRTDVTTETATYSTSVTPATPLPVVSGQLDWKPLLVGTVVGVVLLGLAILFIVIIVKCRDTREPTKVKFTRQKSDQKQLTEGADDTFNSGSSTPSMYSAGSLRFTAAGKNWNPQYANGGFDDTLDSCSTKVLILEPVQKDDGEYDYKTLKAIEHNHALVMGGFGESSTDKTLPRHSKKKKSKKKKMKERNNNNSIKSTISGKEKDTTFIYILDPNKPDGSVSSMTTKSLKRASITKLDGEKGYRLDSGRMDANTISSKAGVAYIMYENEEMCSKGNSNGSSPDVVSIATLDTSVDGLDTTIETKSVNSIELDKRSCDSRDERAINEWKQLIQKEFDKSLNITSNEDLVTQHNEHLFAYDNSAIADSQTNLSHSTQPVIEPPKEFKDNSIQRSTSNMNGVDSLPKSKATEAATVDSVHVVIPETIEQESEEPTIVSHTAPLKNGYIKPLQDKPHGFSNQGFEMGDKTDSLLSVNDNTMSSTGSGSNVAVVQPRLSVKNLQARFENHKPAENYNSLPNPKCKPQNSWKRKNSLEGIVDGVEGSYATLGPASKTSVSKDSLKPTSNGHSKLGDLNKPSTPNKVIANGHLPNGSVEVKSFTHSTPEKDNVNKPSFLWSNYSGDKPSAKVQPQVQERDGDVCL